jgi:S1-C subfamily serine protease
MAVTPRWQAIFPAVADGQERDSTAVSVTGESTMVVVVADGSDPTGLKLQLGDRLISFKVIGHDPVSRLGFISVEGKVTPKTVTWVEDVGASSSAALQSLEPGGPVKCRTTGWVKQVGGKILPFALLRVNFSGKVPPPGTPLVNSEGGVVGIVFQQSGAANVGYAIPAEAVRRVQQDICHGGHLARGWLGLALRAESPLPEICRVVPNSPASAAGIKPNDLILSIGLRPISDYSDAANAFFYLIPGQPVRVKLLRDAEQLEFTLTPTLPKG